MFDIQEELKKLPAKPGVYLMKDASDHIIYVGKALSLKSRVRQYFQESASANAKVRSMVPHIAEFEIVVTDNELEALILECSLIKQHNPKYNVLLKDDKSYPYLKLTTNEAFPRLFITRKHLKDKAKYFGPFSGTSGLHEILDVAFKVWPLRRCNKFVSEEGSKERPCLNHNIGQCLAPCNGRVSKADYDKMVTEVNAFLNGKHAAVIKKLEAEMHTLATGLDFEKAAEVRDKIAAVKRLSEKQKIEGELGTDQDIVAFVRNGDEALVQIFFVRNGTVTGREHMMLTGVEALSDNEVMTEFVKRFYSETTYIPKEIVAAADIDDRDMILAYLSGIKEQTVSFTVPQKGEKLRLVELAGKNAALSLEQFGAHIRRQQEKTTGALMEIKKALGFGENRSLNRIEAYDISNIQGYESVGSMVVFEQGKPKRSDYRKFRVKSVIGADDPASIAEVLTRRLLRHQKENAEQTGNRKFSALPDAIFIDGGAAQVHSAMVVLRELNMAIPVCGMVKDDRHRTKGLLFNNAEVVLPSHSEGFKLLTRIQDEVHRFAIEYHRKLREKKQVRSVLDDIPGIGAVRRKALLKHFGDIEAIRAAEPDVLLEAPGMNRPAAEAVYKFFKPQHSG